MKLHIFTIVLDGMPFLVNQLSTFNRLHLDWHWHIMEGMAMPVKDTGWCKVLPPRLSEDGTTAFLSELRRHPRITVHQKARWEGKTEMCNLALSEITEPCVLLQVDMDEFWMAHQIEHIHQLLHMYDSATFFCRYYVGPGLVTVGENCYGNNPGEWLRAWRFTPGMYFLSHEPPRLSGVTETSRNISREQTRSMGLVFEHYAYAFSRQASFKEHYYGYSKALDCWEQLQQNTSWPIQLKRFFHWTDDRAQVDRI